jgi:hypothetical protein
MFKNILNILKNKTRKKYELLIQLNDKIMPIDRGLVYEDPLIDILENQKIGTIVNSGTMQAENGEIIFCDMTIEITNLNIEKENIINLIISLLEEKGAPKESFITDLSTNNKIFFGKNEGLGLYLDGVNLPSEIYKQCDVNFVIDEIKKRLNISQDIIRSWQGPKETALYFYGNNFLEMNDKIKDFIYTYPLCKNSRIDKIA